MRFSICADLYAGLGFLSGRTITIYDTIITQWLIIVTRVSAITIF